MASCGMRKVYPRVGGGNSNAVRNTSRASGLSPRGRGKLILAQVAQDMDRSIPAWAGET